MFRVHVDREAVLRAACALPNVFIFIFITYMYVPSSYCCRRVINVQRVTCVANDKNTPIAPCTQLRPGHHAPLPSNIPPRRPHIFNGTPIAPCVQLRPGHHTPQSINTPSRRPHMRQGSRTRGTRPPRALVAAAPPERQHDLATPIAELYQ